MIKLIIFDWDDVFTLGSKEGYYACYDKALEGVGVSLPQDKKDQLIKDKWGSGEQVQLEHILKGHPGLVEKAVEIYRQNLFGNTYSDCLTIVPGTQQFLRDIAKRYTLALATGAHPDILKNRVFPKFQIPDVFAKIFTIYDLDDMAKAKPHPHIPKSIMKDLDMQPIETVLVGDAESDMRMAWNAEIVPIAVLTGHLSRQEAEKLGVKHIIDDVTKLESELQKI